MGLRVSRLCPAQPRGILPVSFHVLRGVGWDGAGQVMGVVVFMEVLDKAIRLPALGLSRNCFLGRS